MEVAPDVEVDASYGNYAGGELSFALGENANLMGGYVNYKDMGEGVFGNAKYAEFADLKDVENAIWYVGGDVSFGDFNLNGMYLKGDLSVNDKDVKGLDDDGFVVGLTFKGAEASEVGSYGLFANYYDQGGQTYVAHTTDANTFDNRGFKGYGVGLDYTVAKNMVATVAYYDTESKLNSKEDDQRLWADLTFSF